MVSSIVMYHKQFNLAQVICLHTVKWLNFSGPNTSIWAKDVTLTGTLYLGQNGFCSNANEEILRILQSSRTRASLLDDLVSYPGYSLGDLTPQHRCSRRILQPQPTRQLNSWWELLNNSFIIIIIIIISCWQHGYPWPSLATPPYRSSP